MLPLGRRLIRLSSAIKIIVDGNSIYQGVGGTPMHTLLAAQAPIAGSGATVVNFAISGQSWRMMNGLDGSSSSDVDGALDASKTNILVCGETTNSVGNTARTGAQTFQDAADYVAARRAAATAAGAKLRVVLCSGLPRDGSANFNNTNISACDELMRQRFRQIGADVFCDYRTGSSPFNHDGTQVGPFQAYASLWSDQWLHPATPGQTVMAQMIAAAVRRLPA